MHSKHTRWTPYVKGQKVWLEGTHLSTSHPFVELHPKRFGPFQITETLGSVTSLAKINISYSILFNLTTSYSSYFGGKKGISRNKTSFFLLMVQTESTGEMEDSQHISCNTTISICGDGGIWGKFHRTATRSDQEQTQKGRWRNPIMATVP